MKRQRIVGECTHDVAWNSLCARCGARVDAAAAAAEESEDILSLDHEGLVSHPVPDAGYVKAAFLAHDPLLEVKKSYAEKMEKEAIGDLIREKKGILILDLDHTLFQVTLRQVTQEVPGFETWSFSTELVHSGRLMEDKTYWFNLDSSPKAAPFFIHLRPGLYKFLHAMCKMFELYAYTQGTSEYAKKILTGIDPKGEFFGSPSRLIAREVDPTTGLTIRKTLSRVFPNEEDLVLIIDDRDDVWDKRAGRMNLIKLAPFSYFQDLDRQKLTSLTIDELFHPGGPKLVPKMSSIIDKQLEYLEKVLGDIHSEIFFSEKISTVGEILVDLKRSLFSNYLFLPNDRINQNLFRLIKDWGGIVDKNDPGDDTGKVIVQLGGIGQIRKGPERELTHPWFVLFAVSTLTVPSDISYFAINRIEQEAIQSVWECLPEIERESSLLEDLME